MAVEHDTLIVLEVDLQCPTCFLKVKKLLGSLPQIGDQVFYWDENEVRVSVICCNPEKIRDKICSKAGKAIKNIYIKVPAPPKPKDIEKPKNAEKPKKAQQLKEVKKANSPKELEKKAALIEPEKPKSIAKSDKPKTDDEKSTKPAIADPSKTPESVPKPKHSVNQVPDTVKMPGPVNGYPLQVYPSDVPFATYCGQCYDGGPCHHGYDRPVPKPNGPFGYGYEYGYGGSRAVNVNRLDYFSEENPSGCSIM